MPKHTIEFSLPEESDDLRLAVDAWRWAAAVSDMDEYLRRGTKYGTAENRLDELPGEWQAAFECVREQLHTILAEREISLD